MARRKRISTLETHTGYWLRMVSNHVSHAFRLKVEAQGVTVAEWVVLRALYDSPASTQPSALADTLGLTRGAISKLAARLIAKKLLLSKADKNDRRAQTLALTPAGRSLVPTLAALADRNDAEFFRCLSPRQHRTLLALLQTLAREHTLTQAPLE